MSVTIENGNLSMKRPCPLEVDTPLKEKNETTVLQFAKLSCDATAPTRGSKLSAGYDLYRQVRFLSRQQKLKGDVGKVGLHLSV